MSFTTCTTKSPVRSMLRQVSFFSPRLFRETQMRQVGGSDDTPVKNENGARLALPSSLRVAVQAMGRGRMVAHCQK